MTSSRTLLIGLALSIGVNLLLLGMFAGAALRPSAPQPTDQQVRGPNASAERTMARALMASAPDEDRQSIRRDLRRSWQDAAPLRQRVAQARAEVGSALRSDPYDEVRAVAAFAALSEAEAELKTQIQSGLARRLSDVSPETRERIMESLARRGQRRDRRQQGRQRPPN
ncbi:MAG: periplasmic heavy metal sensor [Pseudomonadota bacterium]